MIWLILIPLTIFAYPGDNVTITIAEPSILGTSDPCMFFLETMNNSAFLSPGMYTLKIGASCSPGAKFVTANGLRIAEITVSSEVKQDKLVEYATWLEKELMKTHMELLNLKEELKDITKKLNETISEKDKIEKEKELLELELVGLNETYRSLMSKYNLLSEEIENKTGKIAQMESEIKSLSEQSANYRIATFFLVSLFVGSFTAMLLMTRRS